MGVEYADPRSVIDQRAWGKHRVIGIIRVTKKGYEPPMKKRITGYGLLVTERCYALTRHGSGRCLNYPMANGRCRLHGGKSLAGTAHGRYKHGKYMRQK